MDWNDLRYVKAIADAGTVAEAANKLGIHQSTVFRKLNGIEKNLGVRLFERLPGGYIKTAAGEDCYQAAERIEADISALDRRIGGRDLRPSGTIRVTMTDVFVKLLTPCLAKFRLLYPEIEMEVLIAKDVLNLTKRDADLAIRVTRQPLETLVGRRVSAVAVAVYASKNYLNTYSNLNNLDFDRHHWIIPDEGTIDSATFRWLKQMVPDLKSQYRFNTCMSILAAIEANMGLALLPCYLGDSNPHLSRLSLPIPELEKELWILTHEDLRYVTRIRTFIDFVASFLAKKIESLEGRSSVDSSDY